MVGTIAVIGKVVPEKEFECRSYDGKIWKKVTLTLYKGDKKKIFNNEEAVAIMKRLGPHEGNDSSNWPHNGKDWANFASYDSLGLTDKEMKE